VDINIHSILDGADEEREICDITATESGPWYADLFHENGSFYQILARTLRPRPTPEPDVRSFRGSQSVTAEVLLCYLNTKVPPSDRKNMALTPIQGRWWAEGNPDLRVLSAYVRGASFVNTMRDFHAKVLKRLQSGYMVNSMHMHERFCSDVVSDLKRRYGVTNEQIKQVSYGSR